MPEKKLPAAEKKIRNRNIAIISVLLLLFVSFILFLLLPAASTVSEGTADFSHKAIKKGEIISLNGDWEFYWSKFLTHEDFLSPGKPVPDKYIGVPGSWTDSKAGAKKYPDMGYGTYRAVIKIPDGFKQPALKIRNVVNAYRLYINGDLIAELGKVSENAETFKSDFRHIVALLPGNSGGEVEIIMQVANFDYTRGGIREGIIFGELKDIENKTATTIIIQIFFIGFAFAIGLFYLFIFFLWRKKTGFLFFAIICILIAIRASVWGEIPLRLLFPNSSISAGLALNFFAGYNLVPAVVLFLMSMYPKEFKKNIVLISLIPCFLLNFLLFTPPVFYSRFNIYFYILLGLYVIYSIAMLSRAILKKRENAIMFLLVFLLLVSTISIEISNILGCGRIDFPFAIIFGNIGFTAAMSYILSRQQAQAQKNLEQLNLKLVETDRLKDKVRKTEMAFLQAQIKPHFLFNALSAISHISQKDGKKGGGLIVDLAMYLRHSFVFHSIDDMSTIEKELEYVNNYINIEKARFGEKICYKEHINANIKTSVPILLFQPLIENAVRHGISKNESGGVVELFIEENSSCMFVEVRDNGAGIEKSRLSSLLTENEGSMGLLNIHNRLIKLYGEGLEIKSEFGYGTTVSFKILKGIKQND